MLELIDRDAAGRICRWAISRHSITTPNICVVVNPNRLTVPPEELKREFGAEIIITNSYIIRRSDRLRPLAEAGLHQMLGWGGPVYTDSGTFQMYSQGNVDVNPDEIIGFQKKIGSDIITPLDMFTRPDDNLKMAKANLAETVRRVKAARGEVKDRLLVGPIQGGRFLDLRRKACKEVAKLSPDVFAIGGIVPLMEQYRFAELADIVLACKAELPAHAPVHAFGAGHPMVFALLAAFGCDLFDSAMYSLAADRGAYLTVSGTRQLSDISEFPCSCPLCSKHEPKGVLGLPEQERKAWLARHNLYVTFEELRTVRQAIRENSLWELVQERSRAHPALLEALAHALKAHSKLLLEKDLFSKRSALMWSGPETAVRPEVVRAKQLLRRVRAKNAVAKEPFGRVPAALMHVYPFGQSVMPAAPKFRPAKPEDVVRSVVRYQYGSDLKAKSISVEVSRKTGMVRRVWQKKKLLGTVRPHDGLFLPTMEGAKLLKMKKVLIDDPEVAKYVREGRSVFAKFVSKADDIVPGEEVAVFHGRELIAVGSALLSGKEMKEMRRGTAVSVRAS
ncbi:MAG: tRNA guanosine(15) transglycosylase TgtA [Candidatus Aenigmatarchaeota archaeon]